MSKLLPVAMLILAGCSINRFATTSSEEYLFSIAEDRHQSEEFNYAYAKNNRDEVAVTDSIDNYLELYINFRLKVKEAKSLGYDTTEAFAREFEQYKNQLDESYLSPKKEQEALIKEAYDRSLWEVKASHVLIQLKPDANPVDTLKAYEKISSIRKQIMDGESFSQLASKYSDDPSAKRNGGDLGYFSVLQMVYPFETAAYNTPVGEISEPIRTRFGYHIIRVVNKRENIGKVQVAHIMIKSTTKNSDEQRRIAKTKIGEIDSLLLNGGDWNTLCKSYSEDKNSASSNGVLRPFGRGQIVPEFEKVAFGMEHPEDISKPFLTQFGWHIIKLIKKIPVGAYDEEKDQLTSRVNRDGRSSIPHSEMIKTIKRENNFHKNEYAVDRLHGLPDSMFVEGKLNFDPNYISDTVSLFTIGEINISVGQFIHSIDNTSFSANGTKTQEIKKELSDFEDSVVIGYEKQQLSKKHPDYKYLLNEYHDGILLFSIMEDSVWNKAMTDSIGISNYYEKNKEKYSESTNDTTIFYSSSNTTLQAVAKRVKEQNISGSWDELQTNLLEEYNISPLNLHVMKKSDELRNKVFSMISDSEPLEYNGVWYWAYVRNIKKYPQLENVKGTVISDYQSYLDARWIESLRLKYQVVINKKELNNVYAKFNANR